MKEAQLNKLCNVWQKRLRLQDWTVKVQVKRAYEMPDNTMGKVHPNLGQKFALILICDERDNDPAWSQPHEQEQTLVHELLHLHMAPLKTAEGSHERLAEEQAVDAIAWALVTAHRTKDQEQ